MLIIPKYPSVSILIGQVVGALSMAVCNAHHTTLSYVVFETYMKSCCSCSFYLPLVILVYVPQTVVACWLCINRKHYKISLCLHVSQKYWYKFISFPWIQSLLKGLLELMGERFAFGRKFMLGFWSIDFYSTVFWARISQYFYTGCLFILKHSTLNI